MLYNPPEKWTEDLLDGLPFGEDDRYERKSGEEITLNKFDDFANKITKEIGAFANSFGGTLFLGIADDNTKVGVPSLIRLKKGEKKIEQWLEQKIPTLFELRLQRFRVTRIEDKDLSTETKTNLGKDKTIIAIDVFDSDLAPHQCTSDHKYYYRVNSESRPAPHHYLAFLWGRVNSNMSQVASWWLKDFVVPIIDLLGDVQKRFNGNDFLLTQFQSNPQIFIFTYEIVFFDREKWDQLISSNVGEYFLSTFPLIEKELTYFSKTIDQFISSLNDLGKAIENSSFFHNQLINYYERMVSHNRIPRGDYENLNLEQIAVRILGEWQMEVSHYPIESKNTFVYFTAYSLLGLNIDFPETAKLEYRRPLSVCKELSSELTGNDKTVARATEKTKQLFEAIKSESLVLWKKLKTERIDIAKRFTATFG